MHCLQYFLLELMTEIRRIILQKIVLDYCIVILYAWVTAFHALQENKTKSDRFPTCFRQTKNGRKAIVFFGELPIVGTPLEIPTDILRISNRN